MGIDFFPGRVKPAGWGEGDTDTDLTTICPAPFEVPVA